MGTDKRDSLIETLAKDSPESQAALVALKRLNKRFAEWIESLGDSSPCILCGRFKPKSEVNVCMENTPHIYFSEKDKSIKADRYAFIACDDCLKELNENCNGSLEGWDTSDPLSWQVEYLVGHGYEKFAVESFTRKEAKKQIFRAEEKRLKSESST